MQFEAQGVQELSRLPGTQSTTVAEGATSGPRPWRSAGVVRFKDALLAIVLPQQYLDEPFVVQALDRWEVKHQLYYEVLHNQTTDAWVGLIYGIVRDFYRKIELVIKIIGG